MNKIYLCENNYLSSFKTFIEKLTIYFIGITFDLFILAFLNALDKIQILIMLLL